MNTMKNYASGKPPKAIFERLVCSKNLFRTFAFRAMAQILVPWTLRGKLKVSWWILFVVLMLPKHHPPPVPARGPTAPNGTRTVMPSTAALLWPDGFFLNLFSQFFSRVVLFD